MTSDDRRKNSIFASLRRQVVTKPDGRYLIYYDSADETASDPDANSPPPTHRGPAQAAWSPEGGPVDSRDNEGDDAPDV
jgi:RecB family endonuclease NucS